MPDSTPPQPVVAPEASVPPAAAPPVTGQHSAIPSPQSSAVELPGGIKVKGFAATVIAVAVLVIGGQEGLKALRGEAPKDSPQVAKELKDLATEVASLKSQITQHTQAEGHAGVPKALGALEAQMVTNTQAVVSLTKRLDDFLQAQANRGPPR